MAPRDPWGYDPTRDPNSSTYIDRRTTVQTGSETHRQVENRITTEDEDQWFLPRLLSRFTRDGRVQDAYSQEMSTQAAQLAEGLNTRQGPIVRCTNYMNTPHRKLQEMVTEDADPDAVGQTGDLWIDAGNEMVKFQSNVAAAINNSESDWQGSAGDQARTFMAGVGNWVGAAGQSAQLAGTQTNLQSAALADAKRNMPEPVNYDPDAARADMMSSSSPFELMSKASLYQQQYNDQQAKHQEAAGVVSTYDNHLAVSSTMPAWGPPPQMSGGTTQTQTHETLIDHTSDDRINHHSDTSSTTGNDTRANPPTGEVDPPPTLPTDPGGPDGPNNPDNPGGPNNPGDPDGPNGPGRPNGPGGPGNDSTNPSDDVPGGRPPGPGQFQTPGPGGNQHGQNPAFPGTPLPIGAMPGPNAGDLERGRNSFGGGRGGFGPGGGYGGGPGGSGPGSGGYGPGGQGASGRGPGFGPGGGMGAGGALAAAEGAAMRGGAGARGAGGLPGGMMPPGQRGESDEDGEHQRASYLVEGDPDALFGTDEMTAPPVIGE